MKSKNKERLQQDKAHICRQIGILPNEEPRLITNRKEMRSILQGRNLYSARIAGLGECVYAIRTIFVDCGVRLKSKQWPDGRVMYRVTHYDKEKGGFMGRPVKTPRRYGDYLNTLAHELVHYRFAYMGHGKKFEQRVKEVIRGRTFEPKHVHLFANYPKRYRENIDANPSVIPLTAYT